MATVIERIVVQATPHEKKIIVARAKKLGLSISEPRRRGSTTYESAEADEALGTFDDAAMAAAADRAAASIDDALAFIEASNERIAARESKAAPKFSAAADPKLWISVPEPLLA